MKTTKKQKKSNLKVSLLLLLLAAVLLISSTYAWFIANTTVSINTIDVRVDTVEGLEISADAITYKMGLTNDDIKNAKNTYDGALNQMPTTILPCTTVGSIDTTSGKQAMFLGTTAKSTNDTLLNLTSEVEENRVGGSFIAFEIFLKLSAAGNKQLYLDKSSNVVFKAATEGAKDKGLQNATRVALIAQNNDPTAQGSTSQALTYSTDSAWQKIWEPNALSHINSGNDGAKAEVNSRYSWLTYTDTEAMSYSGGKAATTNGLAIDKLNSTTYPDYIGNVANLSATPATMESNLLLGTIKPGATKIKVYMWLEGMDIDCYTAASGTDFSFNIVLTTNAA